MGSRGLIGDVHAEFTADSAEFVANSKSAAESIRAVGKAAERTAAVVSAAAQKMDGASRAQANAHARATRAWEREQEANQLAAARASQAAAAAQELARANEMAALKADILARAQEEVGLSTVPVIRSMQLMARTAKETMGETAAQIAEVAEKAELSADGVASAFGGLGALLGGGVAVAFASHALDSLAELNVELGDLHEKTGIAVQDLAGLRLVALSKGLDFTTVSMGLTRLGKAMYEAKLRSKAALEAFTSLGISMKEIDTDSVEQMFYRISKAVGENRSLVLSDGTALQLFGRGGKELVPIMQEYGATLEQASKEQGRNTGITDKSVAASQRWLRATTALGAEMHSALIPALEGMAAILPELRVGWDLLFLGIDKTVGVVVASLVNVLGLLRGVGAIMRDEVTGNTNAEAADWKRAAKFAQSGWLARKKDMYNLASDAALTWVNRNNPIGENEVGQNNPAAVQGGLYWNAQQRLSEMERKHPLNAQQVIAYWQRVLKTTKPGTADYQAINTLVAGMLEDPYRAANLPKAKSSLGQMRSATIGMSAPDAYAYWSRKAATLPAGDVDHAAASANAAKSWSAVQHQQGAYRAAAIRENLMFRPFLDMHGNARSFHPVVSDSRDLSASPAFARRMHLQSADTRHWLNAESGLRGQMRASADAMLKMRIAAAAASGQITRLDAAAAMAALHQRQYSETMGQFNAQIQSLLHGAAGVGLTRQEREAAVARVRIEQIRYRTGAMAVAQHDAVAMGRWQPGSTMVAVRNALDEFVLAVRDTSGQIAHLVTDTIQGVNESLSTAIMAHSYNGWEWRRNMLNSLSGQARRVGAHGLNIALGHAEGAVLGHFGFGPKGKRGDSTAMPLYVHEVGATANASSVLNKVGGMMGKHGVLGAIGGFFQGAFAGGGAVLPGLPALVGERGPELFVPHSAGTIVPNGRLGGTTIEHHYHIDATGATDPAAVEMAVRRAVGEAAPHIVAASVQAVHEHHSRIPTNRRF